MNKINIYVLTFFLSLAGVSIYAQNNRSQVVITSGQDNNVFFHTIEKGQTVYAIATMYGVTPDDIYRLNPDSKEGIKAGATLKIPQRDIVGGTAKKHDGNYIFQTIQPKETGSQQELMYFVCSAFYNMDKSRSKIVSFLMKIFPLYFPAGESVLAKRCRD